MKNIKKLIPIAVFTVAVVGCSNMSSTEQRTLSGSAIGAIGGAAIGGLAGGKAGTGALIGAGVGALGGYLYDQNKRNEDH
jgi:osmotically inducible lipoprotein OsmB